jgi:hypothetical protein
MPGENASSGRSTLKLLKASGRREIAKLCEEWVAEILADGPNLVQRSDHLGGGKEIFGWSINSGQRKAKYSRRLGGEKNQGQETKKGEILVLEKTGWSQT